MNLGRAFRVRLRRAGRPDNPLRRRVDRVERAAGVVGLVAVLSAFPVAVWLGVGSYRHNLHLMRDQLATRQPAIATLTEDAPRAGLGSAHVAGAFGVAAARWSTADGGQHIGYVPAPAGTPAGTLVRIWVDRSGRPVERPLTTARLIPSAVVIGLGTVVAVAVTAAVALGLLRLALDRVRIRAWATEWASVGPLWTENRR